MRESPILFPSVALSGSVHLWLPRPRGSPSLRHPAAVVLQKHLTGDETDLVNRIRACEQEHAKATGLRMTAAGGQTDSERVFVYGTLRRGGSHAWRMAAAEWLGAARVRGRLFRVSWYPALVLDGAAGDVTGELWRVPPAVLAELDRFEGVSADGEGGEYRRVRAVVRCDDGACVEAWAWEWVAGIDGLAELPGGDWLAAG